MRVRCYLRRLRPDGLSLEDVRERIGISRAELSQFERGHSVPRDEQVAKMTIVYGGPSGWYPPGVLRVLMPDLGDCLGCGEELEPTSSRTRRYHDETCRAEARRKGHAL